VKEPGDAIASTRLWLDPLRVEDAVEMAAVLADPALYGFTGGTPPTADELRERYEHQVASGSPDGSESWHNWIIREGEGGPAVGFVQATLTGEATSADVAWVIGTGWQGRGYATEAAGGMLGWLTAHGVRTVTAHIHPDHLASAAVAERLGLKATGTLEDGERVWRMALDPRLPTPAARRRRFGWLNAAVGTALVGFAAFELVMVQGGRLPGGPDQVFRDAALAIVGTVMVVSGLRTWLRSTP